MKIEKKSSGVHGIITMMNKDKLKSLVSKKVKSDSSKSLQPYQMFFFERILRRLFI